MVIEIRSFTGESFSACERGFDERKLVVAEIHIVRHRRRSSASHQLPRALTSSVFARSRAFTGSLPAAAASAAPSSRFGIGNRGQYGRIVEILLPVEIAGKGAAREADERSLIILERRAEAHRRYAFCRMPMRGKIHRHARQPGPVLQHLPAVRQPPVVGLLAPA